MASAEGILSGSPLKAPAIEVVSIVSDTEDSANEPATLAAHSQEEDGSEVDKEDEWSMYEDALDGAVDDEIEDGSRWL